MTEATPLIPAPQLEKTRRALEPVRNAKNYRQQDTSSWAPFENLSDEEYNDILYCVVNNEKLLASVKDEIRIFCYSIGKNVSIYNRSLLHRLFVKNIGKAITNWPEGEMAKEGPGASFARRVKSSETATVKHESKAELCQPDLYFWQEEVDGPCVILQVCTSSVCTSATRKPLDIAQACMEGNTPKVQVGICIEIHQKVSGKPQDADLDVFRSEQNSETGEWEVGNDQGTSIVSNEKSGFTLKLSEFSHGALAQELINSGKDSEKHFTGHDLRIWLEEAAEEAEKEAQKAEADPTS